MATPRPTYTVWMTGIDFAGKERREMLYNGKSKDTALTLGTKLYDAKKRFTLAYGIEIEVDGLMVKGTVTQQRIVYVPIKETK